MSTAMASIENRGIVATLAIIATMIGIEAMAKVTAHTRNVNYEGKNFLRSALMDLAPKIRQNIEGVLRSTFR